MPPFLTTFCHYGLDWEELDLRWDTALRHRGTFIGILRHNKTMNNYIRTIIASLLFAHGSSHVATGQSQSTSQTSMPGQSAPVMPTAAPPPKSQAPTLIPDQYVVVLKPSVGKPIIRQQNPNKNRQRQNAKDNQPARDQNLKKVKDVLAKNSIKDAVVKHYYADVLVGCSAKLSKTEVEALRKDPKVKAVYQDHVARFDQAFLWDTSSGTEVGQYFIPDNVADAGGPVDGSQKETWIWIVDSGINLSHPDLNVQRDAPYAISFTSDTAEDDYGHGTLVAGVAAAKYDQIGATGVSAGAKVVPVKVGYADALTGGYGAQVSDILAGLDHVGTHYLPDDVVNISIASYEGAGCATSTNDLAEAVRDAATNLGWAGVWVCSGAGNNSDCNGATTQLPACVDGYRVFTVGALNGDGTCMDLSNWGSTVDWAAGGWCYSTSLNGQYGSSRGTSFATPIVAGIIHAKGGAPVSSGPVHCCGIYNKGSRSWTTSYRKANLTSLSNLRFDVDLELERFDVANVRDGDGTEDLFGRFDFTRLVALARLEEGDHNFWSVTKDNAIHTGNGSVVVGKSANLINNLSFDELRHIELRVGGRLADEEGWFDPRIFKCQECSEVHDDYEGRILKFIAMPSTLASINTLVNDGSYHYLRFGGDAFFELNYYESNNQNDGWVKVLWKVKVKPHP